MPESNAPHASILIVDDTPTNIDTLIAVLEGEYELSVANSGAQALALIGRGARPDLVLLDVMMPDMDGYQICEALKRDPATRAMPVIFVTAKDDPESEAKGFASGADDFIHKPISKEVVRARVILHLTLRRQREALEKLQADLADTQARLAHAES